MRLASYPSAQPTPILSPPPHKICVAARHIHTNSNKRFNRCPDVCHVIEGPMYVEMRIKPQIHGPLMCKSNSPKVYCKLKKMGVFCSLLSSFWKERRVMNFPCCLCLCVPPFILASQRIGEHVHAAMNTHATLRRIFNTEFSMLSVSYKIVCSERKVDN
jgi:hypothetical protein